MPVTKEFTVLMENRPSMLGKICQALADKEVNILALESFPTRGRFVTRFIVDNPDTAKTVLNNEKLTYADAVRASIASGLLNTAPFLNQSFNEVDTVRSRHVHIRNYQVCAGGSGWTKAFLNHVEGTQPGSGNVTTSYPRPSFSKNRARTSFTYSATSGSFTILATVVQCRRSSSAVSLIFFPATNFCLILSLWGMGQNWPPCGSVYFSEPHGSSAPLWKWRENTGQLRSGSASLACD